MTEFSNEQDARDAMCEIGHRIWLKGFCAGNEGNHSYRLGGDRFLCTPTAVSKGFLKPDDLCLVDAAGNQYAGKRRRTSEFLMHAQIYAARPDVNAIIHGHPPHATAFAIAGHDVPTGIHPEAEVFLGHVPTAPYVTPGDGKLGESVLPFVAHGNTVLLQSHGVVCFHSTLEQCYYTLEIIDAYCRVLLLARPLGPARTFDAEEMRGLMALKARFGLHDPRMAADVAPAVP